jgi:hypothetical protein
MDRKSLSLPERDSLEYNLLDQALMLKQKGYFPNLEVREIVKLLEQKYESEKGGV